MQSACRNCAKPGAEADPDELPLPDLRTELRMQEAAEDAGWSGGHLVHDPVRNSFYRLSLLAVRALSCWKAGTVGGVRACLQQRYGISATPEDILELVGFLENNGLTQPAGGDWRKLFERWKQGRQSAFKWLLHHYLFFRVPLVRPQRFLDAAFPYVRWLGSRVGIGLLLVVFLLGMWLTLKQWEEFKATFMSFVNLEGLLLFGLTIIIVKVAHELGHAFIATRYGVKVPHMGVAFMVMVPMFYTDVTDAWRLKNRRARLLIGMGGMLVELALAGIALFVWGVSPEGPVRTAAFFVATTSLATTLLVNLSPFMRFDGYHILADLLRMHNLQPRAFALALWWLKRVLLGVDQPPPEDFPRRLHRGLILYAIATWIYRFFLFAGIALLVYYALPKVLGIFLAAVEIWWFILRPVANVLKNWWKEREEIMTDGQPRRLLVALAALLVVLFAPIWRSVGVPAVMLAEQEQEVFAPEPARLVKLHARPGMQVKKGQLLARLVSDELEHEWRTTQERLRLVERKLARMVANRADLHHVDVLRRERQQLQAKLRGLEKRRQRLELRAQISGVVGQAATGLRAGVWVSPELMLARIIAPQARKVAALAPETVIGRLEEGAEGTFVPDNPAAPSLKVRLVEIGAARQQGRDILYLSSVHGGPVEAERDPEQGEIHTRIGMFPLKLLPEEVQREESRDDHEEQVGRRANEERGANMPCQQACRGYVVVRAAPESLAGRFARRLVSIFLRESGF